MRPSYLTHTRIHAGWTTNNGYIQHRTYLLSRINIFISYIDGYYHSLFIYIKNIYLSTPGSGPYGQISLSVLRSPRSCAPNGLFISVWVGYVYNPDRPFGGLGGLEMDLRIVYIGGWCLRWVADQRLPRYNSGWHPSTISPFNGGPIQYHPRIIEIPTNLDMVLAGILPSRIPNLGRRISQRYLMSHKSQDSKAPLTLGTILKSDSGRSYRL
jgi:hypothetical protein